MRFEPNEVYHIYNRGNNKQTVFFTNEHYFLFLKKFKKIVAPHCHLLSWCLLENHFHFLIYANEYSCMLKPSYGGKPMQQLSNSIGLLLSSYTREVNTQMGNTGSLFQQKTKAKPVGELMQETGYNGTKNNYLRNLVEYIHDNPVKAGLAQQPEDWAFSSCRDHIGLRGGTLCNKELLFELLGC